MTHWNVAAENIFYYCILCNPIIVLLIKNVNAINTFHKMQRKHTLVSVLESVSIFFKNLF